MYIFLSVAFLAYNMAYVIYFAFEWYARFKWLRYLIPNIYFAGKHLRSPNLDLGTYAILHASAIVARIMFIVQIYVMFIVAFVTFDLQMLLIVGLAIREWGFGPEVMESDQDIPSHRRSSFRLMVVEVLLEMIMLKKLFIWIIERFSIMWSVVTR